jgi:predicted kinase
MWCIDASNRPVDGPMFKLKIEDSEMECVLLIGVPAAGKTTFYRERFADTHDHVSRDLLPHTRHPARIQKQRLVDALSNGRSVVVDDTNASIAVRAPLIALARACGAVVTGYYFPTDAADALRRNRARRGRARVPDVAIFTIRKQLEPPSPDEGFDRIFIVRLSEQRRTFEVESYSR